jgi:acyl dehydratase
VKEYKWDELYVGLKHDFDAMFTAEDVATFARLSGDVNPMHTNPEYAVSAGFAAPILYGLMTSALYSRLVGVYLPGKFALLQGIEVNFHSPCYAGDPLHVQGEIISLNDMYRRIEVRAGIRNRERKLVSKAILKVGFHVKESGPIAGA